MRKSILLIFALFMLVMTPAVFSASNIIRDFNASFDSTNNRITFYTSCLSTIHDANISASSLGSAYSFLLTNRDCNSVGGYFSYTPPAGLPNDSVLQLALVISKPCSNCSDTFFLPIPKPLSASRAIPDSGPLAVLAMLFVCVAVLSIKKRK